jgi:hypothetical protein
VENGIAVCRSDLFWDYSCRFDSAAEMRKKVFKKICQNYTRVTVAPVYYAAKKNTTVGVPNHVQGTPSLRACAHNLGPAMGAPRLSFLVNPQGEIV